MFWHWNKGKALGFSSVEQISLSPLHDKCDENCKGNQQKRLSLAISKLGWRAGLNNGDTDKGYKRIILWRLNMEPS